MSSKEEMSRCCSKCQKQKQKINVRAVAVSLSHFIVL